MALKEEKAQSMFNKWWTMRRAIHARDPEEPPPVIEDCNSLKDCYRWRQTVMQTVGDKIAEIQNAGLGDFKIRALNDEINKYLNHKRMWEARIRQLGGPDFTRAEAKFYDSEGLELPGSKGYLYFGAAKDLPGVRQLFFEETPTAPTKNKDLLYKQLDDEYFGKVPLQDALIEQMKSLEKQAKAKKIERWMTEHFAELVKKYPDIQKSTQEEIANILSHENFDVQYANQGLDTVQQTEALMKELDRKRKELLKLYVGEIEKDDVLDVIPNEITYLEIEEYQN